MKTPSKVFNRILYLFNHPVWRTASSKLWWVIVMWCRCNNYIVHILFVIMALLIFRHVNIYHDLYGQKNKCTVSVFLKDLTSTVHMRKTTVVTHDINEIGTLAAILTGGVFENIEYIIIFQKFQPTPHALELRTTSYRPGQGMWIRIRAQDLDFSRQVRWNPVATQVSLLGTTEPVQSASKMQTG